MTYKNKNEAKKVFRRYTELESNKDVEWFSYSENCKGFKIGDFLLFQHIRQNKISRPILSVFVGFSFWDMALVMNFVEVPRAYFYSEKYQIHINEIAGDELIGHQDPEVEAIQFWTDNINLLGHFKRKPTLSDLRNALIKKI